jgi:hypothetical protein
MKLKLKKISSEEKVSNNERVRQIIELILSHTKIGDILSLPYTHGNGHYNFVFSVDNFVKAVKASRGIGSYDEDKRFTYSEICEAIDALIRDGIMEKVGYYYDYRIPYTIIKIRRKK